uniref:Kinesin-like protein n=3 Tax=Cacopsylla melanoneura TaxID=428564 RepID=A0A8D8RF75_9HEMI
MASVKVAVRVRPFNNREKDMSSKVIIQMDSKKTRISNPKAVDNAPDAYKDFTFDHSYWSFDSSSPQFSSQEQVFNDLGMDVVDAAFEGYNACVFAYGQTGSGKTFTMMGSKDSRGLIPRICEALFQRMSGGSSYRTEVSYLEIYNERVKDLLGTGPASHNLRIRENPKLGPVVQDLSKHLVTEYKNVEELMCKGNLLRTTASTNMNDVSSRSHAIFTLCFVKAGYTNNTPTETVSKVHLVDLAGSERADATGATGDRLKEGAHINKSLVTLGSVISSLAELSVKKSTFVPYRDSVLTWLLKDSLGGNSKTIMIAAISPADVNYSETLSTLRYANRAKNIINKPTVNEDPNTRIIRELHDEITKLKAMLTSTQDSQPQMLAALQAKQEQEKVLTEEWAEKWRETQKILQEQQALGLRMGKDGTGVVLDSDRPHLVRIDDDLCSTGVTLYDLKEGENILGSEDADIVLNEEGVESLHCRIVLSEDDVATLVPHGKCSLNGQWVEKHAKLSQGCLIVMGNSIMLRYNNPAEAARIRNDPSHLSKSTNDLSVFKCNSSEDGDHLSVRDENENVRSPPKDSCKKFLMRRSSMMGINQISDSDSVPDEERLENRNHLSPRRSDHGSSIRRKAMQRAKDNPLQNYTGDNSDMKASDIESDDSEDAHGRRRGKFLSANRRSSTYDPLFTSSPLHPNMNGSNIDIMRSIMARSMPCLTDRYYDSDPNELSVIIPTYVMRGVGTQTHHEYEVRIAVGHERYTIMRRYNRFRELHEEMMHKYGEQVAALLFPPKKFSLLRRSEALARERRPQLESYLSRLLEVVSQIPGSPLNTQTPSRTDLYTLSGFFRKGVFETGKYGTS